MNWANNIAYLVAGLQLVAGLLYLYQGQWRNAVVWCGLFVVNTALAGLK